jgi:hypothetical protein
VRQAASSLHWKFDVYPLAELAKPTSLVFATPAGILRFDQ